MNKGVIRGLPLFKRGKVRDIYAVGDQLLIVATDRISYFDVVLPTEIPGKGKILTALSAYWFRAMEDIASHHLRCKIQLSLPDCQIMNHHHFTIDKMEGKETLWMS